MYERKRFMKPKYEISYNEFQKLKIKIVARNAVCEFPITIYHVSCYKFRVYDFSIVPDLASYVNTALIRKKLRIAKREKINSNHVMRTPTVELFVCINEVQTIRA